jgi:hypothetical protein
MLSRGFQQIDGSERVHFKIKDGYIARFIVRRLRRAVDNQVEGVRFEKFLYRIPIADIKILVPEGFCGTPQAVKVPCCVALCAKKYLAHIVVDADNTMALPVEMLDRFGSNQTAAAGDKNRFHILFGWILYCTQLSADSPKPTLRQD